MNNKKKLLSIVLALFAVMKLCAYEKQYPYLYLYENLPFDMPKVEKPTFPDYKVDLIEYGGVPDGITLNTTAFANAIEALTNKGGGTLVVPSGVWYTGPIVFKSNIELHLEKGALIIFTADKNAYPLCSTFFEGMEAYRAQSPISGVNLSNIAITGSGAINGSGDAWRPVKRAKVTDGQWNTFVKSGGVLKDPNTWFPSEGALKGDSLLAHKKDLTIEEYALIKDYLRPVMVSFIGCKNVLLEGVLFENSPSWNIHPLMCENLIVDGIFVRNPSYSQNGDGLDIESCKNVIVVNTTLDVGDDAICIKSGKDEEGRMRNRPTENVIVDNCRVFKGHGGFVVGSEMSGGVKNISVSNCQFMGTSLGLRFKSARGRGGVVENIYINNINMFDIFYEPLLFDLYYFTSKGEDDIPAVDETTPVFRNIYINNIVSRNSNRAMYFNGLPEMNIANINIENAFITSRLGAELAESQNIKLKNITIIPSEGPSLILNNVNGVKIDGLSVPDSLETIVKITGNRNVNIELPKNINKNKIIREEEDLVQKRY